MRTIEQKLKGYLNDDDNHLVYLGFWNLDNIPRFSTLENGISVTVNVRRFLFEKETGIILDGLKLVRSCDNPKCVKPEHHYYVSK